MLDKLTIPSVADYVMRATVALLESSLIFKVELKEASCSGRVSV